MSVYSGNFTSVEQSKERDNYIAKNAKNYENVQANYTFAENIEFFVATDSAVPLAGIGSEFRAFDITALYQGAKTIDSNKIPIMMKTFQDNWNSSFFILDADGQMSTVLSCDNGVTRESCVGSLTGSSIKTDREGRAFTGFRTPDRPGSIIAVVLKVPEGSSASNLIQYATIEIQTWRDWGTRGESSLQASLLLVPQLENDQGEPVVKAGSGFSVNLIIPGIPSTPKGEGYLFDIETTGVDILDDDDRVVIPNGKNVKCNFRTSVCSLPGGPFKVLYPTKMTITVKPSDPNFPVKEAKLEIPVITGRANTIMLSTTYPVNKITNLCTSGNDFSRPCIELSTDIDELEVYPFLADEGGNFVGLVPTEWSATGPLSTRLGSDKVSLTQTIKPQTPGFGIIKVSSKSGISGQFTYKVSTGIPVKAEFKTERAQGSYSTERIGVPFRVIATLYDRKDNLCVDYNTSFGIKLKLDPVYPSNPPAGIIATASLVDQIDQTINKIQVTSGIGVSQGSFIVTKIPDLSNGQSFPTIQLLESTLNLAVVNPAPITILPGTITQSILRDFSAGLGVSWDEVSASATGTSFTADRTVAVRSDQQFFFNMAGYDAGGNFVSDIPSKFWGVSYLYHPTSQASFNSLVESLRMIDPSAYNTSGTCPSPSPDAVPPSQFPTNQPISNKVYCGTHRGLQTKQGMSSAFQSVGIPGSGRILAIPLDSTIMPAISPILSVVSGQATKFKIELIDTNPAAVPLVLANPISAGKKFKIQVTATDNDGNISSDFTGSKNLSFSASANASWGGVQPIVPSGNISCIFTSGICTVDGPYMFARGSGSAGDIASQTVSSIAIQQVLGIGEAGISSIQANFFRSIPGPEKFMIFANKKGGEATGAVALNPMSTPGGMSITTDHELGFGLAIADGFGNFLRDAVASDNIKFKGFEGSFDELTSSPNNYFNISTGIWSTLTWPQQFTQNDLFSENPTPPSGLVATAKKFYDPNILADASLITTLALKDTSKYSFVLVPQNRIGSGFAVPVSDANPSFVGWPSPFISIASGAIDYADVDVFNSTDPTVNNSNIIAGDCNELKVTLNDKKGNKLTNYSTNTTIRLKIFKVDASNPNGVDDPFVGVQSLTSDQYSNLNKSEIPGPINSGFFNFTGIGGSDTTLEARAKVSGKIGFLNYNQDYASYTSKAPHQADWWSGSVTVNSGNILMPGTICLQEGQTLANRLTAAESQKIIQVELEPSTFAGVTYPGLISRGAKRIFSGYGSSAPLSMHNDILTVKRGQPHHIHGAFEDNFQDPKLAWLGATAGFQQRYNGLNGQDGDQLGVEAPCPYPQSGFRGGCVNKTIYWHIHDSACNYIGPATNVVQDNSAGSYFGLSPAASGPQGSSAVQLSGNIYTTPSLDHNPYDIPRASYVQSGTLKGSWYVYHRPGRPAKITLRSAGFTATEALLGKDLSYHFILIDQYNNLVLGTKGNAWTSSMSPNNPYLASKETRFWSDIIPSNAPTGQIPKAAVRATWDFNSYATAIRGNTGILDSFQSTSFRLYKANERTTFFGEFKELAPSEWCSTPGNCPSTNPGTISTSFTLDLDPDPALGIEILSAPRQDGLPFTSSNLSSIFAPTYPLPVDKGFSHKAYACLYDQYRNMFDCNVPSNWSVVDSRDRSGSPTADQVLDKPVLSVTNWSISDFIDIAAYGAGSARLSVSRNAFTTQSDPIVVAGGPLDHISITSFGFADQLPISITAGQEIPVLLCLEDKADKIIDSPVINNGVTETDPNLTYNISFFSSVSPNAAGKSLIFSTSSGAAFDSNSFGLGVTALQFVNGCKTIYLKNYASGPVLGSKLLTVTTSDPLRPTAFIGQSQGISVSYTTPGALDGFVTSALQTSNIPILGSVPAWSNVQANAGYANVGGNRFDLKIEARDAFGNNIPTTGTVNLTRVRDDGVTAVSRPMICQGQTTIADSSCLIANFANSSEVIVPELATDLPGRMYIMASNGSIGTRTYASQLVNFQGSSSSVAGYSIISLPTDIEAGIPFIVKIAALDSTNSVLTGIDSILSAQTFSLLDSTGAHVSTHLSPNNSAPTLASTFAFSGGIGIATFTLTKSETLSFRVQDATGIQSALSSIIVRVSPTSNYQISCKLSSDNSNCSGSSGAPYPLLASRANLIDLVVTKTDQFGNKKKNLQSLFLAPVRQSGSLNTPTMIQSTTAKSYVYDSSAYAYFISFSMADDDGVILDNLYYGVGDQTVTFNLLNKDSSSIIDKNVYINFLPHIDTVRTYQLYNFGSTIFAAGTNKTFQVRAVDIGNNSVSGLDSQLNAQLYTWSGGVGNSPYGNLNIVPTSALTFTNGYSQNLSATFYSAKAYSFYVTDNWSSTINLNGAISTFPRTSNTTAFQPENGAFLVEPNLPSGFSAAVNTTQQAGVPFGLTLSVRDVYGNLNEGWTDSISFSYLSGASSSISNPVNSSVFTATKAPDVIDQVFVNGTYTPAGSPFTLYRSNLVANSSYEVTRLKIQGTNISTASGSALSTTIDITTTPKTDVAYAKINSSATYSAATNLSGLSLTYSTASTYNYYHYLFDEFGNMKDPSSAVQWTGTGALANKMTPTSGATTVVAPVVRGTGVITADCSAISGCLSDSTGTISLGAGPLSKFTITDPISTTANLGQEIPVSICMADDVGTLIDTPIYVNSVLITNPDATLPVEIRQRNIIDTPESSAIKVSKASGAGFDGALVNINSGTTNLNFMSGCTTVYAKILSTNSSFGSLNLLQVRYDDTNQPAKGIISSNGFDVPGINTLPLDHYVTIAQNTGAGKTVEAFSDLGTTNVLGLNGGNRFDLQIFARDIFGNSVTTSNAVTLSMVRSNGSTPLGRSLVCSAPSNDTSCLNPSFSNSNSLVVNNLALDVAGSFYVKAETGAIGFRSQFSDPITFIASPNTVKKYVISHPAQVTAGDDTFIQIRAEDNSGGLVLGADASLGSLTFTFYNSIDSTLMSTHIAPDLTDPILPTSLTFSGGVASPTVRFVKSESGLNLNVRDNFIVQKFSTNVANLNVNPGTNLYYDITCKRVSDASDCTGSAASPAALLASAADKFDLEFRSYDLYKNPKMGDGSARALLTRMSGSANNPGILETITGSYTFTSSQLDVNLAILAPVQKLGMFYRVGNQTVEISLTNATATGYYRRPYLTFTPTLDTVRSLIINTNSTPVAGQAISLNVEARDSGWNRVTGIDAGLNALSYTWSGPANAPNGSVPVFPSGTLTFVGGIATGLSITYKKAETVNLLVTDNYTPCGTCSNVGGWGAGSKRNNAAGNSITVSHAPTAAYSISGALSPKAGVPFDLTVTALDEFNNPATTWGSDSLNFSWNDANSSAANQVNPSMSPTVLASGVRSFTGAAFTSSGTAFTLYKVESPTITVTGTQTAGTKNGSALTATKMFTVLPSDTAAYVKLSESSNPLNANLSGAVFSQQTDQTKTLFAHLYDPYTNIKSNSSLVAWTGSSILAGKLNPATGSNTLFAPTASGTGVLTASCSSITAGCQPDSTGSITIDPSNVSKIVFISPSPSNNFTQLTTACQQLQVQTQDLVNNPANVNSDSVFTFNSTGGNGDFYATSGECNSAQGGSSTLNTASFHTSTLSGSAGSRTKTMTAGTNVISVWYANRTAVASNAAQISVAALSRTANLNATISPDTARRVSFITTNPTVNAVGSPSNTCLTLNYRFNDIWGNQQSLASASTINFSITGADNAGTIHSDSGCTSAISSRSLSSGNQDTVYYKDTKANRSTFNVLSSSTLNGTVIQAANSITIDVLPGTFTITETPSTGSYTKDTVTLFWGASAGAKNYTVSYGVTSACGITISSTATGPSLSFTLGLNGLFYICVIGNSYTSGGANLIATNYGSYNFYIDNLAPTGAITSPTLSSIGPVTAQVGTGITTTFTGTASDTGGAGLSKVELEIKTGSNYWDGSIWTPTPSVVLATGTSSWSYAMLDSNFTDAASYSIRLQVTDNSNNVSSSAATKNFTWDTAAPTVSITPFGNLLSSDRYSNATSLNTAITTSSGAVSYQFYIVSGGTCSGGTYSGSTALATNITSSLGVDNQYTLCVLGKDLAENVQITPTSFTWYKDTVAPTISGGVANVGPVNASYTPSLAAATDLSSPAGSVITYLWSVSSNASGCTTAFGNTAVQNTSITSTCASNFGTSTLRLRVSDTSGNITDYSPTFNWDSQSRSISSISSPLSAVSKKAGDVIDIDVTFTSGANSTNVFVTGGTPTLALNTSQSATYVSTTNNVIRFSYTIQAGDNQASLNVSGTSALNLNGAAIRDTYSNNVSLTTPTNTLNTRNIVIDTTAPTLVASGVPTSESNTTSLNVAINATDTNTYTYSIVSGTSGACPGTQSGSIPRATNITNSISGMPDGDITICARATDLAGNVQSGFTSYTWKKDTVAPAVPSGVSPSGEVNTLTPTINWNAAAADVTSLRVRVFSNTALSTSVYDSGVISFALTSQIVSPALPRDAKYFICVLSQDLAGNWSTCAPTSFSVETDTLHISWLESGNVQYGKKDKTSSWAISTAASGLTYQGRTSLAVDSSGNPAIGYGTTDGTNSSYRYSRWNGTSWTAYNLHTSLGYTTGGTMGALVVASTTPTFQAGFLALDAGSSQFGVQTGTTNGSNVLNSLQAIMDNGSSFLDLGIFLDSNNIKYTVATPSISGIIRPVITEASSLDPFTPSLPTNCSNMPYVSGVSRQSGSSFAITGICVMNDSSCQVWHGTSTFTTTPSWTAMTWTNIGTARTSGCTLGNLTVANSPNIMQDKQTDKSIVVFTDVTNNKIVRASNESGSWVNEDVITGLSGNYGFPFVAVDQYSKSYVTFIDNGILYMTNNNGREHLLTTGGWNTPSVISNTSGISGFAGIAINGMKGRGNYTGGK